MMARAANRLPAPLEYLQEQNDGAQSSDTSTLPSTLKVAVTMLPESKMLSIERYQDMWISVDVQGVIHNQRPLADASINLVFLVDNGYVSIYCRFSFKS